MEYTMKNKLTIPIMVSMAVLLAACGGGGGQSELSSSLAHTKKNKHEEKEHTVKIPLTPSPSNPVITTPTAGRLLASQCAQCHGTDGVSITDIDSLAGESQGEIIDEMLEMSNKNKNELMHLQAKGYSAEQVSLIADYFSGIAGKKRSDEDHEDEHEEEDDD